MKRIALVAVVLLLIAACGDTTDEPRPTIVNDTSTDELTTTDAPEPDATDAASSETGTRDNPVPAGTAATVGDYTVTVTDWTLDATAEILAFNEFVEPPPDGSVFSLVRVAMTYDGEETGTPFVDFGWGVVGDAAVTHDSGDCYTYPEPISDVTELFPGGAGESNVCFTVAEDDGGLVLFLEEWLSLSGDRVFFELP